MSEPLVSAVMVTRNRVALARRALQCLRNQTWPNLELVIVDDGDQSYEELVREFSDDFPITYHQMKPDPEIKLGGLRNLSQDLAKGEYLAQWDDDEWYQPDGDVLAQPAFALNPQERASTEQMLRESRELGLLEHG